MSRKSPKKGNQEKKGRPSGEKLKNICKLMKGGTSIREISRSLNVPVSTLSRITKRLILEGLNLLKRKVGGSAPESESGTGIGAGSSPTATSVSNPGSAIMPSSVSASGFESGFGSGSEAGLELPSATETASTSALTFASTSDSLVAVADPDTDVDVDTGTSALGAAADIEGMSKTDIGSCCDELLALPEPELVLIAYPKKATVPQRYAGQERLGKYMPDFAELAAEQIVEKRRKPVSIYHEYVRTCAQKSLQALSESYFYRELNKELCKISGSDPTKDDYYFIQEFDYGMYAQLDYSGSKYRVSTYNGEIECWLMVMTFPASYFTFAGFVTSQSTAECCRTLAAATRYLGNRMPSILFCDNAKCWVTSHATSDVIYNPSFLAFTAEMGVGLMAAAPRHPQAKSAVEASVNRLQTIIDTDVDFRKSLTDVRTLADHSVCLQQFIEYRHNQAPFRKDAKKTRDYLFNTYEKHRLQHVKCIPEFYNEVKSVIVPRSYHVEINGHQYSVPYYLCHQTVEVYLTNDHVIIKHDKVVVAKHARTDGLDNARMSGITTDPSHMAPEHQAIEASNKRKLPNPGDILSTAKGLDAGLYQYCSARLGVARNNPTRYMNHAIIICNAVIGGFRKAQYQDLYSKACIEVIGLKNARFWNKEYVDKTYEKLQENMDPARALPQGPFVNPASGDDAFFKSFDCSLEASSDMYLSSQYEPSADAPDCFLLDRLGDAGSSVFSQSHQPSPQQLQLPLDEDPQAGNAPHAVVPPFAPLPESNPLPYSQSCPQAGFFSGTPDGPGMAQTSAQTNAGSPQPVSNGAFSQPVSNGAFSQSAPMTSASPMAPKASASDATDGLYPDISSVDCDGVFVSPGSLGLKGMKPCAGYDLPSGGRF